MIKCILAWLLLTLPVLWSLEEVNQRGLETLVKHTDFVAALWLKNGSRDCEEVASSLETIEPELEKYNVQFVKIYNKRYARSIGIREFPSLSIYKAGDMSIYPEDVHKADAVLDYFTKQDVLQLPDNIELVDRDSMDRQIIENEYIAVLVYDQHTKEGTKVLQNLETIDDEADLFEIRFVRIDDEELFDEYSLISLPSIIYFRNRLPVVFTGDIFNQMDVFEFLLLHKHSADDDEEDLDSVELIDDEQLGLLIEELPLFVVLFYQGEGEGYRTETALEEYEKIQIQLVDRGIFAVKSNSSYFSDLYHIHRFPMLVYFEMGVPTFWPEKETLDEADAMLKWIYHTQDSDHIEEVTKDTLDRLVSTTDHVVVLFYSIFSEGMDKILAHLENIDDDLDEKEVLFIKTSSIKALPEYGVEQVPSVFLFRKGIPAPCPVSLLEESEGKVRDWALKSAGLLEDPPVIHQYYRIYSLDDTGIFVFKTVKFRATLVQPDMFWDVEKVPNLVFMGENEDVHIFTGDMNNEEEVLSWLKSNNFSQDDNDD